MATQRFKGALPWILVAVLSVLSVILWISWWALFPYLLKRYTDFSPPSSISDIYSILGTFFAMLAFIGVISTFNIQQRAAGHVALSSEFFQLLGGWQELVHNTIVKRLDGNGVVNGRIDEIEGRAAFVHMSESLQRNSPGLIVSSVPLAEIVRSYYDLWFAKGPIEPLGHYFRLLYHIVRTVDTSVLNNNEKTNLVRLVRAHLSEAELHLLFWNGLSKHGESFKPLIDKYDLLQNFSFNSKYHIRDDHIRLYMLSYEHRKAFATKGYG